MCWFLCYKHKFRFWNIDCHMIIFTPHQVELLLAYTQVLQMQNDADTVDVILRQRRRRTPRRSSLLVRAWLDEGRRLMHDHYHGFMPELRYKDPISYLNYLRMQTKRRQHSASAVNVQCIRSDNSMHTMEAPWERHESAGNRQLEHRRNAMALRRNAMVAVRTPFKRREKAMTSPSICCDLTALCEN